MKHEKHTQMISLKREPASTGEDRPGIAASISEEASHPSAYISHPSLPKMKVGQKVKLHGVVSSVTHRSKEGGEEDNSAEISLHHMEPIAEAMEGKKMRGTKEDEDAIEEGMRAAENNKE